MNHRPLWPWGLASAALVSLSACGGPPPPSDPPLVADPPIAGTGPVADDGAVQTELQRGLAYSKAEKWAEAKEHFEKAIAIKATAEGYANLAVTSERMGDRAGAEKAYKQALTIDPGLVEAAQNLAALYLDDPPRPDEAIALLKTALAKSPDPRLYQNLGYALGVKGDLEGAGHAYEAALGKGEDARIHFDYGALLLQNKQPEKAVVHLKKALDGAKEDPGLLGELGSMLGRGKAFPECVRAYDRAIKIKGNETAWFVGRGLCKHQLDDEPGAQADFEEAIKIDGKIAAAHYYLALSHLGQKSRGRAITELEKAMKLGAGKPIGKLAKDKFDELTKKKR